MIIVGHCKAGRRVGMADEADSKSVVGNHVWVQVPSPAVWKSLEIYKIGVPGFFYVIENYAITL